jgi:hypothetical protein
MKIVYEVRAKSTQSIWLRALEYNSDETRFGFEARV